MDTINFDGRSQDAGIGYTFDPPYWAFTSPNRPIYINMTNFNFNNIPQVWNYGFFYLYSSGTEVAELSNFMFHNVSCNMHLMEIVAPAILKIKNFTVEESLGHIAEVFKINSAGDVQIEDIYFKNFTNQGASQIPPFSLTIPDSSSIVLTNLNFEDMEIASVPLINLNSAPVMVNASNFMFKDIKTPDEESLLNFLYINSL